MRLKAENGTDVKYMGVVRFNNINLVKYGTTGNFKLVNVRGVLKSSGERTADGIMNLNRSTSDVPNRRRIESEETNQSEIELE